MSHKKGAFCTDIHFGKKGNSEQHNKDCIAFLEWFKVQVQADPSVDYIAFLGDWHENRSSLNISTLNYSQKGAEILNSIGLPVYFVIGNHDLYRRHTRDVHSVIHMENLNNFTLIDEPIVINDMLFSPFLFPHEYIDLVKYADVPVWAGHFEFKGFLITGYGITMPTGPDPKDFAKPKRIFSGHFHKRQQSGNIIYTGNTFPMDFSDAGDDARGMTKYDHDADEVAFIDWPDCPRYLKCTLTDIFDDVVDLPKKATVECTVDIDISFKESAQLRETFIKQYDLRDIQLEEAPDPQILADAAIDDDVDLESKSTNDLVVEMLNNLQTDKLDKAMLVDIYTKIPSQIET